MVSLKIKKIIVISIIFNFFSCKNDVEEVIQYDKKGNVLSKNYVSDGGKSLDSTIYFKNNKVDSKFFFKKNSDKECYIKFYNDGKLIAEGNAINKIKIGKWKFYGVKVNDVKIVEFKNICGEEYSNQEWNYDNTGKMKINLCTYYTYQFKNPILKNGTTNALTIKYIPMVKKGSISTINFSNEIDSTFCNVDKVQKNAFRSSDSLTFTIPMMLDEIGKHNFRGYIEEHVFEETQNSKLTNHKTKKVYIDIPFEVN